MSSPVEPKKGEDVDVQAIAHRFMLLVVYLEKLNIRILLCKLADLQIQRLINKGISNTIESVEIDGLEWMPTLGWRALQPAQPGEKKSTITSWFPAFVNESTRSCAELISFMLGWRPFSHHFMAFPMVRAICDNEEENQKHRSNLIV